MENQFYRIIRVKSSAGVEEYLKARLSKEGDNIVIIIKRLFKRTIRIYPSPYATIECIK